MAGIIRKKAAPETISKKTTKVVKKKRRGIASFLILFFFLAALVSILVFNLFNIRDRYIYPFLSGIPLVGGFIPITSEPENFGAMTADEMLARINKLDEQLFRANEEIRASAETIDRNNIEINRLKVFEEQQLRFKQEKADFDRLVAMADPQAYTDYYESIYPENAEILYPRAAAEASRASKINKYLSDITQMDEVSAAIVFQQLIGTDMDLVVSILQGLDSRKAGAILSELSDRDPRSAASVLKMMAPLNVTPVAFPTITPQEIVNQLADMPELP